jgi:hypothetical protein
MLLLFPFLRPVELTGLFFDHFLDHENTNCPLAQLVEQLTVNQLVRGSSPRGAAILQKIFVFVYLF